MLTDLSQQDRRSSQSATSDAKPKAELKMVAMFGGTFDPVHNGHLQTVWQLKNDLAIDQVHWVPSAQPPHREQPGASAMQRLAMLELALKPYAGMCADDIEIRRQGPSYTVLTAQELRQQNPDASLVLIVGADAMQSFHTWYQHERILQLTNLIVMHRAGYSSELSSVLLPYVTNQVADLQAHRNGKVLVYPAPAVPISATLVRQNLHNGVSVTEWVPAPVVDYIVQHDLYREAE